MSGLPIGLVLGAAEGDPPPGIEEAAEIIDLRFAADAEDLAAALPDADALFSWLPPRGALEGAWRRATRLRWIQTASAGVDSLLFPALVDSDVVVTNARGVFDDAIAEWVVGAMLAFVTGLHRSVVDQPTHVWHGDRRTERLAGTRLAVVGPGSIGRAVGTRALQLGMSVTMVGRTPRTDETFGDVLGHDRLHDSLRDADHVLNALPLTAETRGLFDATAFDVMPATARLYNVGRGDTVDEPALVEALRTGGIAGAALDVFHEEPLPPDHPFWAMPNVIVSPHVCGDFEDWEMDVVRIFVANARRWVAGEPLANIVDKATLSPFRTQP
jgi:phosphoglycerate dehydrogenase-like enzyme